MNTGSYPIKYDVLKLEIQAIPNVYLANLSMASNKALNIKTPPPNMI